MVKKNELGAVGDSGSRNSGLVCGVVAIEMKLERFQSTSNTGINDLGFGLGSWPSGTAVQMQSLGTLRSISPDIVIIYLIKVLHINNLPDSKVR